MVRILYVNKLKKSFQDQKTLEEAAGMDPSKLHNHGQPNTASSHGQPNAAFESNTATEMSHRNGTTQI